MKIGILGSRGIPNAYGGFEKFSEHLAHGLLQKGHDVFVYSSSLNPYKEKKWRGVNIIHCKDWEDKLGTAGQFLYDLNCINNARKKKFDVLLHLGYTSDSIWHRRWPRTAINLVNMDGLEWKRSKYSKAAQRFLKKAEAWAALSADHLIADSLEIKNYLLKRYNLVATYISYGAELFDLADETALHPFNLKPKEYYVVVARLERENNIEMIVNGYLTSRQNDPLLVVGNITSKYAKNLIEKYRYLKIRFVGGVYDKDLLNNLRYFSKIHFHGHSVGGTNPSLLEAMACSCRIAAHDNSFNRIILQNEADYFSDEKQVSEILNMRVDVQEVERRKQVNRERIKSAYNWDNVINDYEQLMTKLLAGVK